MLLSFNMQEYNLGKLQEWNQWRVGEHILFSLSLLERKWFQPGCCGKWGRCTCACAFWLVFFLFFLMNFGVFFFPTGTSCFTVLGLTKHLPAHVLNSASMHGYIWAEWQVGHHARTHLLLDMKRDMGLNVSPLLSPPHANSGGGLGSRCMPNKLPELYSWLESSELSVFQMQFLDLLQTETTEAQDKYSTFVRETKIWGLAFCLDLPKQRRRKCCLSCAETENRKSYKRTSLYVVSM